MSNVAMLSPTPDAGLPDLAADPKRMPAAMRVMLDEDLFRRAERFATMISEAKGIVPQHLLGEKAVCFSVVLDSLDSGLSPYFLAQNTFPVKTWDKKAGAEVLTGIGYQGKLIRARMEASGFFEWIDYVYEGDWTRVQGRWKWQENDRGRKYQVAAYNEGDEKGLVIIIKAKLKGRARTDELPIEMSQLYPRNSTLWATDPKTQCAYAGIRRFCSLYCPHVLGGMRFEDDFAPPGIGPDHARDVTPRGPTAADRRAAMEAVETVEVVDPDGAILMLQPGEVEARVREMLAQIPNAEALQEWRLANEAMLIERGLLSLAEEARLRFEKSAAKPGRTITMLDTAGAPFGDYGSYGEWLAGLDLVSKPDSGDPQMINANWDQLVLIAKNTKAPPELRRQAQAMMDRAPEPADAGKLV